MISKTLYIPIEIFDRELGGGVLLAAEAVVRGWKVVLGGKQGIFANMTRFRKAPGVFFLKSIVPGEVFKQKEIMSYGHRIISLDVEGLVPSSGESGVRLRYSDTSVELTDVLFFWGENHFDSVRSVYSQANNKGVVSGSPIIDEILIRGRKARAQRTAQKKKILIGTSCGYANHMNGIGFSREMTRNAYAKNADKTAAAALECEALLDQKIFEFWKEAVPRIGESFKGFDVVLRPHPSENRQFWKNYLKNHSNIRIDEEGSILDEMVVSDVYIHFNSTSSLTSTMLGIPTIMPLPEVEKKLADRVTFVKNISITASTADQLIERIKQAITSGSQESPAADLTRYCENLKPGHPGASRVIVDALESRLCISAEPGKLVAQQISEAVIVRLKKLKFFLMWLAGRFLTSLGFKPGAKFPPRNAYKNAKAKQPNTSLGRVEQLASELLDPNVRLKLRIRQIARNVFELSEAL